MRLGDRGQESRICPDGWADRFEEDLDFRRAYDELEGYEHYYSYAWRGYLRTFQLRPDEAIQNLDESLRRAPPLHSDLEDVSRRLVILGFRHTSMLLAELMDPSPARIAATDAAALAIDEFECPETPISIRLKTLGASYHALMRHEFEAAKDGYLDIIEKNRATPEVLLVPYLGAAVASHELGLHSEVRRHYSNFELSIAFAGSRPFFGLACSWLYAFCAHWGWDRESERWHETLMVLECCEETKRLLLQRANLLASRLQETGTIIMV